MKKVLLFLLFFLISLSSTLIYFFLKQNPGKPINNIIQTAVTPTFSVENPPSDSIKGNISNMAGEVFWQSRVATGEAKLNSQVTLAQGEEVRTGETGTMSIEFPAEVNIQVSPKTQIDFVQTLPVNFIAGVASGSAQFTKLSQTPVSIRTMHLLTEIQEGKLAISVDQDNSLVGLNVIDGSIKVAFNDNNLISKVSTFQKGQKVTFNDSLRTLE